MVEQIPQTTKHHGRFVALLIGSLFVAGAIVSCRQDAARSGSSDMKMSSAATTQPTAAANGEPAVSTTAQPTPEPIQWKEMGFNFPPAPGSKRTTEEVAMANATCVACHTESDAHTMHQSDQGIS